MEIDNGIIFNSFKNRKVQFKDSILFPFKYFFLLNS